MLKKKEAYKGPAKRSKIKQTDICNQRACNRHLLCGTFWPDEFEFTSYMTLLKVKVLLAKKKLHS